MIMHLALVMFAVLGEVVVGRYALVGQNQDCLHPVGGTEQLYNFIILAHKSLNQPMKSTNVETTMEQV